MPSVSASGFVTDADPAFKFVMFIMGSGGHTTEMLSMIERSIWPAFGMYRRYVVNEGDRMSYQRVVTLETRMGEVFAAQGLNPGLFDIVEVKRARRVHQGWLTTPLSAALSLVSIVRIILAAGTEELGLASDERFPGVVLTNGPGTGFLFVAAAHLLKVAGLVPEHRLRAIYVESAAKVRTLSLTGRLLRWTGMSDIFVVQHAGLAGDHAEVPPEHPLVLGENFVVTPPSARVLPLVVREDDEQIGREDPAGRD